MNIENPGFNRLSPESKKPEQFTPKSITEYVRANESLPDISEEELRRINDEMTQEEVVGYHVMVNTLEDQEKSRKLLEQWIPKPKVLYHATDNGSVTEFEPRDRHKRKPDDPPQVFGATSKAVAAMMMAPGDDGWTKTGSYDGQRTWTCIYADTEEFRQADTGGYIYELPPDGFTCDPHIGLGLAEWASREHVRPIGEATHYSSSIEAMLRHGVKVYRVAPDTFRRFQSGQEDHIKLLENLEPISEP